ncbi:MAG: hypothetical protein JSR21_14310 [Proteobacteria bacterium]|nr:hypothetical protein [Pseudomonadota bacterium]
MQHRDFDAFRTGRRGILRAAGGLALGLAAPAVAHAAGPLPAGVPQTMRLTFEAFRKDSRIGTHKLQFDANGGALTVRTAVDFAVGLGPITLFRYTMRTVEQWENGRLVSVMSKADNDGTQAWMEAKADGQGLVVDGSKSGRYRAPAGAIAATHWNPAELRAPSINPENGELMRFAVADRGTATIDAAGANIPAQWYQLTGPATLDLWYDRHSVWSALRAVAKDGSIIEYRLA